MNKPHLRSAYILISFIMFMPVLFWPVPLLFFGNPIYADSLAPTWFLCISLLLMTVVSIDSILYGITNRKQIVDATLWISMFAMITVIALQNNYNSWVLAILFLLHSLRSGYHLFFNHPKNKSWWLWLAWGRDITASLVVLLWLNIY